MTFQINASVRVVTIGSLVAAMAFVAMGFNGFAAAQEADLVDIEVRNMTAVTSFSRSTPCAPYTIDWGDGDKTVEEGSDGMCIQMIDDVTHRHEYEAAGTYQVAVEFGGETYTEEVVVPTDVEEFTLADVISITSKWVDPSEMMADEEYYIYTITLESGSEVEVQVAGFTTEEWRNETFAEAGYTGDVAALLALAEPEEATDEPAEDDVVTPPVPTDGNSGSMNDLRQQLIVKLKLLVEKMTQLLNL